MRTDTTLDRPGEHAREPSDIPAKGWVEIAKRIAMRLREDNVSLSAAGVAFFAFLSLVPAMAAVLSVYGLISEPEEAVEQMKSAFAALPSEAQNLLETQVSSIAESSSGSLSITLVVSILLSLWAASSAVSHLFEATNAVYDETDGRNFLQRRGLAVVFTIAGVVAASTGIWVLTWAAPALADAMPTWLGWLPGVLSWVLIGLGYLVALAALFRFGPDRDEPEWSWVTPGAVLALLAWMLGSLAFSFYVSNFGSYNETYGSLAAVVVLLFWLFISAFVVLLAGEVNSEMERQTSVDTTTGADEPVGDRGAFVADHGPSEV